MCSGKGGAKCLQPCTRSAPFFPEPAGQGPRDDLCGDLCEPGLSTPCGTERGPAGSPMSWPGEPLFLNSRATPRLRGRSADPAGPGPSLLHGGRRARETERPLD